LKPATILPYRYPLLQSLCLPYPARYSHPLQQPWVVLPVAPKQLPLSTRDLRNDRAPLVGFWFPSAYNRARSPLAPALPQPARSALEVCLPPQRLTPPNSSRGSFTPERSWDSPFRAFPSGRAVRLSAPLPSCCYSRIPFHGRGRQRCRFPEPTEPLERSYRVLLPTGVRSRAAVV
jgi:hypothetical protein